VADKRRRALDSERKLHAASAHALHLQITAMGDALAESDKLVAQLYLSASSHPPQTMALDTEALAQADAAAAAAAASALAAGDDDAMAQLDRDKAVELQLLLAEMSRLESSHREQREVALAATSELECTAASVTALRGQLDLLQTLVGQGRGSSSSPHVLSTPERGATSNGLVQVEVECLPDGGVVVSPPRAPETVPASPHPLTPLRSPAPALRVTHRPHTEIPARQTVAVPADRNPRGALIQGYVLQWWVVRWLALGRPLTPLTAIPGVVSWPSTACPTVTPVVVPGPFATTIGHFEDRS